MSGLNLRSSPAWLVVLALFLILITAIVAIPLLGSNAEIDSMLAKVKIQGETGPAAIKRIQAEVAELREQLAAAQADNAKLARECNERLQISELPAVFRGAGKDEVLARLRETAQAAPTNKDAAIIALDRHILQDRGSINPLSRSDPKQRMLFDQLTVVLAYVGWLDPSQEITPKAVEQAIRSIQREKKARGGVDGVVGKGTWEAIKKRIEEMQDS